VTGQISVVRLPDQTGLSGQNSYMGYNPDKGVKWIKNMLAHKNVSVDMFDRKASLWPAGALD
jgi:hypothetical protein